MSSGLKLIFQLVTCGLWFHKSSGSVNASDALYITAFTRKYIATAEMAFQPKLYGLTQCTPTSTGQRSRCPGYLQPGAVAIIKHLKR